jgi:hypothetical protein
VLDEAGKQIPDRGEFGEQVMKLENESDSLVAEFRLVLLR